MVVGAAGDDFETALNEFISKRFRILNNSAGIGFKFWRERFAKRNSLSGDHMHQRTTLHAGEHGSVYLLRNLFIIRENDAAARATQCFMRC